MKGACRIGAVLALLGTSWVATALLPDAAHAQFAPRPKWRAEWRQVGPLDYAVTGTSLTAVVLFELLAEPNAEGGWGGGAVLDATARNWLRFEDRAGRNASWITSQVLTGGLVGMAVALDPWLYALGVHGDLKLAWQLFVINTEAVSVALVLARPMQLLSNRSRPLESECAAEPGYHRRCPAAAESFFSTHSALAFAAASANCMAHARIPLYGGGLGDHLACVASIGTAAAVGALQVSADMHWLTDVLLGSGVGLASGYLLPWLLHYRTPEPDAPVLSVLPIVGRGRAAVALVGTY